MLLGKDQIFGFRSNLGDNLLSVASSNKVDFFDYGCYRKQSDY